MYDLLKIRQLVLNQDREVYDMLENRLGSKSIPKCTLEKFEQIIILGKLENYKSIISYLYSFNKSIISIDKDDFLYDVNICEKDGIVTHSVSSKDYINYVKQYISNTINIYLIYTELDDFEIIKFLKRYSTSNINYVYYINKDYFSLDNFKNNIGKEINLINYSDVVFTNLDIVYYTNKITNRIENIKLFEMNREQNDNQICDNILYKIYSNINNIDFCIDILYSFYHINKDDYRYFYMYIYMLYTNSKYDRVIEEIINNHVFLDRIIVSELIYLKSKQLFDYFKIVLDFYLNGYNLNNIHSNFDEYIQVLKYYAYNNLYSLKRICKYIITENIKNLSDSPFINMCYSNL